MKKTLIYKPKTLEADDEESGIGRRQIPISNPRNNNKKHLIYKRKIKPNINLSKKLESRRGINLKSFL